MATPYNQVSRDAGRALEEFSDEFRTALTLGEVTPWASIFGHTRTTDALKTTYPIPLDSIKYDELKGDIKFDSLFKRSLSMTGKEFSAGVQEKARVIEAPDFIDWAGAPARIANDWMRLPNRLVRDRILKVSSFDGPLLDFYRDEESGTASTIRLFANNHPFNVLDTALGTFTNFTTATIAEVQDGSLLEFLEGHFRSIKGPNGEPLGLRVNGGRILAPGAQSTLWKKFLEHDTLIRSVVESGGEPVAAVTQNNIWQSTVGYEVADELDDDSYCYAFAGMAGGMIPPAWIVQTNGTPEERVWDKDSELYLRSSEVAIAYVGEVNVAACLPHAIVRIQITDI